jgi:hypothetical protein
MQDLMGISPELSNIIVRNELKLAGIMAVEVKPDGQQREIPTIIGALRFADGTLAVFRRRQFCWSVTTSARLPYVETKKLNDDMGSAVRIEGYDGGRKSIGAEGCRHWHVDTQDGLKELASVITRSFGGVSRMSASEVAAQVVKHGLLNDASC